jgi:hypothetical protein
MRRRLAADREPLLGREKGLFLSPGFFAEGTQRIRAYLRNRDSRLQREDARWGAETAQYHGAPVRGDPVRIADCKWFF